MFRFPLAWSSCFTPTEIVMKTIRLLPLAVAAVSLAASAQTAKSLPAVTDSTAPVVPFIYQSVFSASGKRDEDQPTPDKLWIGANQQLAGGSQSGHAGHIVAPAPAPAPASTTSQKTEKRESKPQPAKHEGHRMPAKEN